MEEIHPSAYGRGYFMDGENSNYINYNPSGIMSRIADHMRKIFRMVSVLELGCAYGHLVHYLQAPYGVGVDISRFTTEKKVIPNFINSSASHLPFKDNTFDMIVSVETLEHLTEAQVMDCFDEVDRIGTKWFMFTSPGPNPNPKDDADTTHINCKEPEEWFRIGEERGWKLNRSKIRYFHRTRIHKHFRWAMYIYQIN